MAIQPIDLQTMYSQLSNVSKSLSGAQQSQLTEAMQQQANIQKNLEKAAAVQQTSNEKSSAAQINQNGSNSSGYYGKQNQKKQHNSEEPEENRPPKSDLDYLGTIIDIMR